MFGNKQPLCVGTLQIITLLLGTHVIDVTADIVDVNVPISLRLVVLTNLKVVLHAGIMS